MKRILALLALAACDPPKTSVDRASLLDNETVVQWTSNPAVREFPIAGLLDTRRYEDVDGADVRIWWGRHPLTRAPDGALWFTKPDSDEIARVPADLAPGAGGGDANGTIGEVDFKTSAGALAQDIVATRADEVWFTELRANKLGRIRGGVLSEYALGADNNDPTGIAAAPDGTIWIAESGTQSIARVTVTNDEVAQIDHFPIGDDQPRQLTIGGDGNIYIAAAVDIFVMSPQGALISTFSLKNGSNVIGEGGDVGFDIVTAPTGEVYAITNPTGVSRVDPTAMTKLNVIGGESAAFGPDGKLWAAWQWQTYDDIKDVCDDPTTGGISPIAVTWPEPYLARFDLAHGTSTKLAAPNIVKHDSKCHGNKIRGVVGSAPSSDATGWRIFFLENWTGHLGVLDIDPCTATGSTCGTQTLDQDTFSCGECSATAECVKEQPPYPGWGCCALTTCASAGATCGTISDGCAGTLDCGTCGADERCDPDTNQCVTGAAKCRLTCSDRLEACQETLPMSQCMPDYHHCLAMCSCVKTTCAAAGATCGTISDGCEGTLDCGGCAAGYACNSNQCQCVPQSCNGRCGTVSDGCGGTIDCGRCGCSCDGKRCGASDGCGGTCWGYCPAKKECTDDGDGLKYCAYAGNPP